MKQETGKTVLYAVNVTGAADKLIAKARLFIFCHFPAFMNKRKL
ncbi:hypothetical protein RintRC_6481 [Richelia intracellularis]|nr:hypothetical protein RintRC_6481 [Richelia intracellularis]